MSSGKGSKRRPSVTSWEEQELRWKFITTNMSQEEFMNKLKLIKQKEKEKKND